MNIREKIDRKKIGLAAILITVGVLGRIILHDFFNNIFNPISTNGYSLPLDVFFVIATVSIFSGILLGKYYAIIVPVCIIALTDLFYAFINPINAASWTTSLFLFTWSGFVVLALMGNRAKRKTSLNLTFIPRLLGASALSIIFYDLWTNFGFWLLYSKMGFYAQNIEGLSVVYIGGIPSMIWHLLSTSLAITAVAVPMIYLKEHKLLQKEPIINPMERYVIASVVAVLMVSSIITAFL